jgi:hypothetical protein
MSVETKTNTQCTEPSKRTTSVGIFGSWHRQGSGSTATQEYVFPLWLTSTVPWQPPPPTLLSSEPALTSGQRISVYTLLHGCDCTSWGDLNSFSARLFSLLFFFSELHLKFLDSFLFYFLFHIYVYWPFFFSVLNCLNSFSCQSHDKPNFQCSILLLQDTR